MDKSVAKTVAQMLNAQVIGGKKGDRWVLRIVSTSVESVDSVDSDSEAGANRRWRDDIWTMKYLSGFKWEMLGEQVGE